MILIRVFYQSQNSEDLPIEMVEEGKTIAVMRTVLIAGAMTTVVTIDGIAEEEKETENILPHDAAEMRDLPVVVEMMTVKSVDVEVAAVAVAADLDIADPTDGVEIEVYGGTKPMSVLLIVYCMIRILASHQC
eukprot:gb/GECG01001571.1/.p1 GENE.gb/GECG01001571.1/~~gb/GECG01001571.1/.p1  ORF type:complete len:133 (+),score=11.22 gb/GECG01001571.1/:1-399(+)